MQLLSTIEENYYKIHIDKFQYIVYNDVWKIFNVR